MADTPGAAGSQARDAAHASECERTTRVLTTGDGRLRVEFHWLGDRFGQRFIPAPSNQVITDGAPVGQSIEGGAEDSWPPSPPIQQLSAETIAGRPVLLGVGAAGQSHWSISVESIDADGTAWLKFDVACRWKSAPERIGSRYRLAPGLTVEPIDATVSESNPDEIVLEPSTSEKTQRWSYRVGLSGD